jgi:hypothetical protein
VPEKDITGLAIERAQKTVQGALKEFRRKVPYGPKQIKLTPKEFRRAIKTAAPEDVQAAITKMGTEQFLKVMLGSMKELESGETQD